MAKCVVATITMGGNNIILIGMMCSGKSTAGRALAGMLHRPFADIDAAICAHAGKSVAAIFASGGERAFRQLESEALSRTLQTGGQVIATGGGIVCTADNIRQMHADETNAVCYLQAPLRLLSGRALADNESRPLLAGCDNAESVHDVLAGLLAEREPLYRRAAHCCVNVSADATKEQMAMGIIAAVLSGARFVKAKAKEAAVVDSASFGEYNE